MSEIVRNYRPLRITREHANDLRVHIEKLYNQTFRKTKSDKVHHGKRDSGTMFEIIFSRDVKNNKVNLRVIPHVKFLGKLLTPEPKNKDIVLGATYLKGHFFLTLRDRIAVNMGNSFDTDKFVYKGDAEERTDRLFQEINYHLSLVEQGGRYGSFGRTIESMLTDFKYGSKELMDGEGEVDRNESLKTIQRDIIALYKKDNSDIKETLIKLSNDSEHPLHKAWSGLLRDPRTVITKEGVNFRNFLLLGEFIAKDEGLFKELVDEYSLLLDKNVNNVAKSELVNRVDKAKVSEYRTERLTELIRYVEDLGDSVTYADLGYIGQELLSEPENVRDFTKTVRGLNKESLDTVDERSKVFDTIRGAIALNEEDSEELTVSKLWLTLALDNTKKVDIVHMGNTVNPYKEGFRDEREDPRIVHLFTNIWEETRTESAYIEADYKLESFKEFADKAFDLLPIEKASEYVRRAYNFKGEEGEYGVPFVMKFPQPHQVVSEYYKYQNDFGERFNIDRGNVYYDNSFKFKSLEWVLERVENTATTLFEDGLGKYKEELVKDPQSSHLPELAAEYQYATQVLIPELREEVKKENQRQKEDEEREARKPLNRLRSLFGV